MWHILSAPKRKFHFPVGQAFSLSGLDERRQQTKTDSPKNDGKEMLTFRNFKTFSAIRNYILGIALTFSPLEP
jgi:hypothetical protein